MKVENLKENQVISDFELPLYQTAQQFILTENVEDVDTCFLPTSADLTIFHAG